MDPRTKDQVLQAAAKCRTRDERQAAVLGGLVRTLLADCNSKCVAQRAADILINEVRDSITTAIEAELYRSLVPGDPVDMDEVDKVTAMWRALYDPLAAT